MAIYRMNIWICEMCGKIESELKEADVWGDETIAWPGMKWDMTRSQKENLSWAYIEHPDTHEEILMCTNCKGNSGGIFQARSEGLKECPRCLSTLVALWAGDGMWDYDIECLKCGHKTHGTSLKQTIRKWNLDQNGRREKTRREREQ